MTTVLFFIATVTCLAGALGVVFAETPLRSALALIFSLVGVGSLFFLLRSPLIGAVQLLLASGQVLVLLLFIYMAVEPGQVPRVFSRGFGLIRTAGLIAAGYLLTMSLLVIEPSEAQPVPSSLTAIGTAFQTTYVVLFIASAVLLVAAMIAAAVVARQRT